MVERKDLAEVEPIVAQWIRERGTMMDGASYAAALELAAYVVARRTTPDREAIIEECAKVCDEYAADQWSLYKGRAPYNGSEAGRADPDVQGRSDGADVCAERIRTLKTAPTTSPRDTLIEEIAEMVDHMGEGRRLEEYVGAIREMKSGDKGGA